MNTRNICNVFLNFIISHRCCCSQPRIVSDKNIVLYFWRNQHRGLILNKSCFYMYFGFMFEICKKFKKKSVYVRILCKVFAQLLLKTKTRDVFQQTKFNHILVSFGNPDPIDTTIDFPDALYWAQSPWPLVKTTWRVPPPPHPSFFTVKSILIQKKIVNKNIHVNLRKRKSL